MPPARFGPTRLRPIPSIVVILRPLALATGSTQERVAVPSRCTVHAPHTAMPQPNLVPVMSSTSRSTQSSGISRIHVHLMNAAVDVKSLHVAFLLLPKA